ncbi:MAG: GntR family transcriptional regulator [Betaproteobacteria bacterium]|jgi:DNA-binding GntR family transcriptional regulator|nr:MAG: GntR family transcriptional regulator [Betaproteobacteria bacterium]
MRRLQPQPTLVDQVYEAILLDISAGKFGHDARLIQEELAESLGVSRQPVQQALLLLRNHGILRDAPGRGLMVAPLEAEFVRNLYEVRAVLDGLASSKAAERGSDAAREEGPAFITRGREAVASRSIAKMIAADMDFHFFLYGLSQNPLIAETSLPHWSYLRRVMGEVLLHGETPGEIWDQHEAILNAVISADANEAERVARLHISHAATTLTERLPTNPQPEPVAASASRRTGKRVELRHKKAAALKV